MIKTLSPTQHACLEAMGIDVWVSRDSTVIQADSTEILKNTQDITAEQPQVQNSSTENKIASTPVETGSLNTVFETNTSMPDVSNIVNSNLPKDWNELRRVVSGCQFCVLHAERSQTVFGSGNEQADWLIIGDTPTRDDDGSGQPFSGEQGDLLNAMLRAIGLTRQQVYLANIIKCYPPNQREPDVSESDTCIQYLKQQIVLIQPKLILVVGQTAAQRLLNNHSTLARLRQKVHALDGLDIPVVVTYHPASLLSMPANKRDAWQDLLFANKIINSATVL